MKDKTIQSSTGLQMKRGVRKEEMATYYPHKVSTDWAPEFRKFLGLETDEEDRHSTPHDLYSQCADWYKTTGREGFTAPAEHKTNLLAWIDYLNGKGLL